MHTIVDTEALVSEGLMSEDLARNIESRARATMVTLAINLVLCAGILFATFGLIFWLADAMAVAVVGALMLAGGAAILARGGDLYRMFGNAATLIGAGMLIGGAGIELVDKYEDIAPWVMVPAGALIAAICGPILLRGTQSRFVVGSVALMGLALHLVGLGFAMAQANAEGLIVALFYLYAAIAIGGAGWLVDNRLVTALAIVPFAQALDTGTFYFHAAYVFYSPEPTLSILQMALLVAAAVWGATHWPERTARHARITAIMGFVVANLCALVGSLWGDHVGETLWGPGRYRGPDGIYTPESWDLWRQAQEAFHRTSLYISEHVYTGLWAVALAALIAWSAHTNRRGLFNASVTFAGIHAYTQMFETFSDEPLAFVIGGLAAIPLAWGMWRANQWFVARAET